MAALGNSIKTWVHQQKRYYPINLSGDGRSDFELNEIKSIENEEIEQVLSSYFHDYLRE